MPAILFFSKELFENNMIAKSLKPVLMPLQPRLFNRDCVAIIFFCPYSYCYNNPSLYTRLSCALHGPTQDPSG